MVACDGPLDALAAVYSIPTDCAERRVLGPNVAIDIEATDKTIPRIFIWHAAPATHRGAGRFRSRDTATRT